MKKILAMLTMFIVFKGNRFDGSGLNLVQSTALGMTAILYGSRAALKVKFSLLVWDTEIA